MPFTGFRSLLPEKFRLNEHKSARRYIHIDGTPVGKTGIGRYLWCPHVQASMIAPIFSTAATALCTPGNTRPLNIAIDFVAGLLLPSAVSTVMVRSHSRRDEIHPVIDKNGHLGSMPSAIDPVVIFYKKIGFFASMITFGSLAVGSIMLSDMYYGRSAISLKNSVCSSYALGQGFYLLAVTAMCFHAQRQLSKGEWTLSTPPSSSKKPKEEKTSAVAEAPTRTFGSAFRRFMNANV